MSNRRVFFVSVYAVEDGVTPIGTREFVVASRRQAKRLIHRVKTQSLGFYYGSRIEQARQDDLRGTGWIVRRQGSEGLTL
jgi:hypothetical protein